MEIHKWMLQNFKLHTSLTCKSFNMCVHFDANHILHIVFIYRVAFKGFETSLFIIQASSISSLKDVFLLHDDVICRTEQPETWEWSFVSVDFRIPNDFWYSILSPAPIFLKLAPGVTFMVEQRNCCTNTQSVPRILCWGWLQAGTSKDCFFNQSC